MRYYWEALFSVEYFPYWEFTMLMVLLLNLSMLYRVHRIEKKIDKLDKKLDEQLPKKPENLYNILTNFNRDEAKKQDWNAYKDFTPDNVMKQFQTVFLDWV